MQAHIVIDNTKKSPDNIIAAFTDKDTAKAFCDGYREEHNARSWEVVVVSQRMLTVRRPKVVIQPDSNVSAAASV